MDGPGAGLAVGGAAVDALGSGLAEPSGRGAADDAVGIGAAALGAVDVVSLGSGAAEVVALGVDEEGVVALEDVMAVGSFPCGPTRPVRRATG